jgi:hypothetical protein
MSRYRHNYRVFEVSQTMSSVQFEVILLSTQESLRERRQQERVTTGQCMGKIRLVVDLAHIDQFPVGRRFAVVIEALESEKAHEN